MDIGTTLTARFDRLIKNPAFAPAKREMSRVLDARTAILEQHAKHAADRNLTGIGRQDAMRKQIAEKFSADLTRAKKAVPAMQAKIAERRQKLMPPAPDKTDVAAAVLRSEMRTMIKGMKPGERHKILLSPDADILLLSAVLEAPNFSTGIDDQVRGLITTVVIDHNHPGALAAIEQAEEAISFVNAATRIAMIDAQKAGDFPTEYVLTDFLEKAVGDTARLDADIDRTFADLANVEIAYT